MRLYLSSYSLGNHPEYIPSMLGANKRALIIMNAQDFTTPEKRSMRLDVEMENLRGLGLLPEELDLRSYFDKPEGLKDVLSKAGFIWVRGGNVFLLRKAFKQSGFDTILKDLLESDAIAYGGFSAGICILTPTLRGTELVDEKDATSQGYDAEIIWDGLGIVDYAIAPHYKSDHPESEDIDKYVDYLTLNRIPYKTLHDGEAIVIDGDKEYAAL